jgi:hypothetical protein
MQKRGFEQIGGLKVSSRNFKIDDKDSLTVVLDEKGDGNIFASVFLAGSIPRCVIDLAGSSDRKKTGVQFASPEDAQTALEILNTEKNKKKSKNKS